MSKWSIIIGIATIAYTVVVTFYLILFGFGISKRPNSQNKFEEWKNKTKEKSHE